MMHQRQHSPISFFQKHLSAWVLLCMCIGVAISRWLPSVPQALGRMEYAQISIPIAILIWGMIYPMMMKVDFQSIGRVRKQPGGLVITWVVNWLIKPFTMYWIASFFFNVVFRSLLPEDFAKDYLAGAVLLGAAPCTAMVFVWSALTKGDPAYTVLQVATNDLILPIAFIPIVKWLLEISNVTVPWSTLIVSVVLFVLIPLFFGSLTRYVLLRKGQTRTFHRWCRTCEPFTVAGLLLTLVLIFALQGHVLLEHPLHILLIAIPLILQTVFIFALTYGICYLRKMPHCIAAPAGMIGASNFFELAVAVAIAVFGVHSPVALATVVGVLTEVPVMLLLVRWANRTAGHFPPSAP